MSRDQHSCSSSWDGFGVPKAKSRGENQLERQTAPLEQHREKITFGISTSAFQCALQREENFFILLFFKMSEVSEIKVELEYSANSVPVWGYFEEGFISRTGNSVA